MVPGGGQADPQPGRESVGPGKKGRGGREGRESAGACGPPPLPHLVRIKNPPAALTTSLPPSPFSLQDPNLARLCAGLRANSPSVGECGGRLLRLKRYLPDAGAPPAALDALIDALAANATVEALYLQNLTHFTDAHLEALVDRVLTRVCVGGGGAEGGGGSGAPPPPAASPRRAAKEEAAPGAAAAGALPCPPSPPPCRPRVWAVNLGELPSVSEAGWAAFTASLPRTAVAFMYMSEHVLGNPGLKDGMRAAARANRAALLAAGRPAGAPPPADLCGRIKNMWFNPGPWRERLVGGGAGAEKQQRGAAAATARARGGGRARRSNKTEWSAAVVAVPPKVAAPPPPPPPGAFLTSRQWAMREAVEVAAAPPAPALSPPKKKKKAGVGVGVGGCAAAAARPTSPKRPAPAASPAQAASAATSSPSKRARRPPGSVERE